MGREISRRSFLLGGATVGTAALVGSGVALTGCTASAQSGSASESIKDGTYTAAAEGKAGEVEVEVVVAGGSIDSVSVTKQEETEEIAGCALVDIPEAIVAGQTLNVDAVSGATLTSMALLSAVQSCIEQAGGRPSEFEKAGKAPSAKSLTAGTYNATMHGHHSMVSVQVELTADAISKVEVTDCGETPNLSDVAVESLPQLIVDSQSFNVDTVSGATFTSRAILSATEDCIKQAGGAEAARAFGERVEGEPYSSEEKTIDVDVLVVGAGLSGMCSAMSAQDAGSKVLVIEKLPFIGGASQTAAGWGRCPAQDTDESRDAFFDYIMNFDCGWMRGYLDAEYPQPEYCRAYTDNAYIAFEWLHNKGIGYDIAGEAREGAKNNHYRFHADLEAPNTVSTSMIAIKQQFEEAGGEILLETALEELLTDSSGAVVGATAAGRDGVYTINAKSVVLCAGGFGGSKASLEKYAPLYKDDFNATLPSNTGDAIAAAASIGAAVHADGQMMGNNGHVTVDDVSRVHPYGDDLSPKSCLKVDPLGMRVNAENPENYTGSSTYVNAYEKSCYFQITNQEVLDSSDEYKAVIEEELAAGNPSFYKADDLDALAEQMGIQPMRLRYTLNRYNAFCQSGADEDFGKKAENLVAMTEGPWYAAKVYMEHFGTIGGLKSDGTTAVLDEAGSRIANLYACGETSNHGLTYVAYMGCLSIGGCVIMGYLAGQNAAANALG